MGKRNLNRPIIRALVYLFVKIERGKVSAACPWLYDQVETNRIDLVENSVDDPTKDERSISYDSILQFYLHGKSTSGRTLDAFTNLLEVKGYLDTKTLKKIQHTPMAAPPIVRNPLNSKQREDLNRLAGIHYLEEHEDRSSDIKSLFVGEVGPKVQFCELSKRSLTYERSELLRVQAFEHRLDQGFFDCERIVGGFIKIVLNHPYFELRPASGESFAHRPRGGIKCVEDSRIRLASAVSVEKTEDYVTLSRAQLSGDFNYQKLTIRQRNNILRGRKRYLDLSDFEFRRVMSGVFTELDRRFLKAAEDTKPIEMIEALVEGANINAVDPETGKTALHFVAQGLDMFSMCVLGYDEEHHQELLSQFKGRPGFDTVAVNQILRLGHEKLDPLVMDNENRFPSEYSDPPYGDMEAIRKDPIAQIKNMIYCCARNLEDWAIQERGLPDFINDEDVMSMEDRLAHWANYSTGAVPKPDVPGF